MPTLKVVGIEPGSTDEYLIMAAAWRACTAANVTMPQELVDYFEGSEPVVVEGTQVEIPATAIPNGLDIDPTSVPTNIKTLRFTYTP